MARQKPFAPKRPFAQNFASSGVVWNAFQHGFFGVFVAFVYFFYRVAKVAGDTICWLPCCISFLDRFQLKIAGLLLKSLFKQALNRCSLGSLGSSGAFFNTATPRSRPLVKTAASGRASKCEGIWLWRGCTTSTSNNQNKEQALGNKQRQSN